MALKQLIVLLLLTFMVSTLAKPLTDSLLDTIAQENPDDVMLTEKELADIENTKFETPHGKILAVNMALTKRRLETSKKTGNAFENIEKVNDAKHLNLYQGDIQLDEYTEEKVHLPVRSRTKRNSIRDKKSIWQTKVIPYTIPSYMSHIAKNVLKATKNFEDVSCLRFVPYRPGVHKNYITFDQRNGCSSRIGMNFFGGKQPISIAKGCNSVDVIMHEMLHALGFFHEQARADRDKYVKIYWENILDGTSDQFDKYTWKTLDDVNNYDYKSIMHYERTAFTKNGKPTIVAIGNEDMHLDNRQLSKGDIIELNTLYDCQAKTYGWSSWSDFTPCDDDCYKSRQRYCYHPGDVKYCQGGVSTNRFGVDTDKRKCTQIECLSRNAIHGHWGNWLSWTKCSASCDSGVRKRFRKCDNPKPGTPYGKPCPGDSAQTGVCTVRRCHLDTDDTDFDSNKKPFGMWTNKPGADLNWIRHKSYTKTMETGPERDHTTGEGYYLYVESTIPHSWKVRKAILKSKWLDSKYGALCLKFAYSMYGRTTGSLSVSLRTNKGTSLTLLTKKGDQGKLWKTEAVSLDFPNIPSFQIEITAGIDVPLYSDIAIDDVYIDQGLCSCQDKYSRCSKWANEGECDKNPTWMGDHCPRSCKKCQDKTVQVTSECVDKDEAQCPLWADKGECTANESWMSGNCAKSCGKCKVTSTCSDDDDRCGGWAKASECSKNPDYMLKHCKKSCGVQCR